MSEIYCKLIFFLKKIKIGKVDTKEMIVTISKYVVHFIKTFEWTGNKASIIVSMIKEPIAERM